MNQSEVQFYRLGKLALTPRPGPGAGGDGQTALFTADQIIVPPKALTPLGSSLLWARYHRFVVSPTYRYMCTVFEVLKQVTRDKDVIDPIEYISNIFAKWLKSVRFLSPW